MGEFTYAHGVNPVTLTSEFNHANIDEKIINLLNDAASREIPCADEETLCFLKTLLLASKAKSILELGTAVGISAAAMASACPDANIVTVERDERFFSEARKNLKDLGYFDRVKCINGDAGEEIAKMDGQFDFIFLDCAKVQYIKYLPHLKRLLKRGGVLFADDVLLYGYLTGTPVPKKRKMLAFHISEFVEAVTHDGELLTTIVNIGDGVALSVKL